MHINVPLIDSDYVEIEPNDVNDMWDYLMEDIDELRYRAIDLLNHTDNIEYYAEELRPLYNKLKEYYD